MSDAHDWQELIDRHLRGELSESEKERLAELLDSDAGARKDFVEQVQWDTRLAEVLRALTAQNARSMADIFRTAMRDERGGREMAMVMDAWGRVDGPAAVAYAEEFGNAQTVGNALTDLLLSRNEKDIFNETNRSLVAEVARDFDVALATAAGVISIYALAYAFSQPIPTAFTPGNFFDQFDCGIDIAPAHVQAIQIRPGDQAVFVAIHDEGYGSRAADRIQSQAIAQLVEVSNRRQVIIHNQGAEAGTGLVFGTRAF